MATGRSVEATTPAVAADGTIYVTLNSSLYAVRPDNTERWRFLAPSYTLNYVTTSPIVDAAGTIYFATKDFGSSGRTFYAARPDGTQAWSYPIPGPNPYSTLLPGPAIGSDGRIYLPVAKELRVLAASGG